MKEHKRKLVLCDTCDTWDRYAVNKKRIFLFFLIDIEQRTLDWFFEEKGQKENKMLLNSYASAPAADLKWKSMKEIEEDNFVNNAGLFRSYKVARESKVAVQPLPDTVLRKSLKREGLSTAAAASDMSPWQSYDQVSEAKSRTSKRRQSLSRTRHVKTKVKSSTIQSEKKFIEEQERTQFIRDFAKAPQLKMELDLIQRQQFGGSSYSPLENVVEQFSINLSEFVKQECTMELLSEQTRGSGNKPIFQFEQGVDFDFAALETLMKNYVSTLVGWEYEVNIKFEVNVEKVTVNNVIAERLQNRFLRMVVPVVAPWKNKSKKCPTYICEHSVAITPLQIFYGCASTIREQLAPFSISPPDASAAAA